MAYTPDFEIRHQNERIVEVQVTINKTNGGTFPVAVAAANRVIDVSALDNNSNGDPVQALTLEAIKGASSSNPDGNFPYLADSQGNMYWKIETEGPNVNLMDANLKRSDAENNANGDVHLIWSAAGAAANLGGMSAVFCFVKRY